MKISILCPSRGRPLLAYKMARSALEKAFNARDIEILFYLNEDDPERPNYLLSPFTAFVDGPDGPTSYAWNLLAKRAAGDILMLVGDDVEFTTQDWDRKLSEEATPYLQAGTPAVFSFDDGRSELGTAHPHPAMNRTVYNRLGYLACPMFRHWCVDTWLVEIAKKAACFHYLADIQLAHQKPSDSGAGDETHQRIRRGNFHTADMATLEWARAKGHDTLDSIILQCGGGSFIIKHEGAKK